MRAAAWRRCLEIYGPGVVTSIIPFGMRRRFRHLVLSATRFGRLRYTLAQHAEFRHRGLFHAVILKADSGHCGRGTRHGVETIPASHPLQPRPTRAKQGLGNASISGHEFLSASVTGLANQYLCTEVHEFRSWLLMTSHPAQRQTSRLSRRRGLRYPNKFYLFKVEAFLSTLTQLWPKTARSGSIFLDR
ncbi:hypothetical protein IF1G_10729 [Cordyceps javanica]|uniref:Uncharacterized protein n=1 Tax=Cordyceps javanica TaxID=43265 RepID=A0A545UM98_9HYPO|nr:hypothetical protein IF1G_10729 [Cordyceps javanica]